MPSALREIESHNTHHISCLQKYLTRVSLPWSPWELQSIKPPRSTSTASHLPLLRVVLSTLLSNSTAAKVWVASLLSSLITRHIHVCLGFTPDRYIDFEEQRRGDSSQQFRCQLSKDLIAVLCFVERFYCGALLYGRAKMTRLFMEVLIVPAFI